MFAPCEHGHRRSRMRVISKGRLIGFLERYPDADSALRSWLTITLKANWKSLVDVRRDFPHADLVGRHCTVFNIRGGKYRLVTHIDFRCRLVFVRSFLTHADYDKGDWKRDC